MGKNSYDSNYIQLSNRLNQFTEMEIKIAVALERWGWRCGSTRKSQENFLSRRVWVHLLKPSKYTLENDLISACEFRSVKKEYTSGRKQSRKTYNLVQYETNSQAVGNSWPWSTVSGRQTLDSAHVTDSPAEY